MWTIISFPFKQFSHIVNFYLSEMIRTNHVGANEVNLEMVIGKILVLLPFHSLFSTVNTFWYLYHINKKEKKNFILVVKICVLNNFQINIRKKRKTTNNSRRTMLFYSQFFVAAKKNSRHRTHFHTYTCTYIKRDKKRIYKHTRSKSLSLTQICHDLFQTL